MSIQWMVRRDLDEVCAIENDSFDFPWSENEFVNTLKMKNCIGLVLKLKEEVLGYTIYSLSKNKIEVLNLAVKSSSRRRKYGTALLQKLISKLSLSRRQRLIIPVSEHNLGAQLFLKSNDFCATEILYNHYESPLMDAYKFVYAVHPENDSHVAMSCANLTD